jgi:amino acid permease
MFFGVAVFAFEGNAVIISIHNSMKEPYKFHKTLKLCMILIVIVVVTVSCVGYYVSS